MQCTSTLFLAFFQQTSVTQMSNAVKAWNHGLLQPDSPNLTPPRRDRMRVCSFNDISVAVRTHIHPSLYLEELIRLPSPHRILCPNHHMDVPEVWTKRLSKGINIGLNNLHPSLDLGDGVLMPKLAKKSISPSVCSSVRPFHVKTRRIFMWELKSGCPGGVFCPSSIPSEGLFLCTRRKFGFKKKIRRKSLIVYVYYQPNSCTMYHTPTER